MAFYPFILKILRALLPGAACLIFSGVAWAGVPEPGHHLFADSHGRLWAWGGNDFGQLGCCDIAASRLPVPVEIAATVVSAAAGRRHSVALDSAGAVWVWGDNSAGQLGTGDFKRAVHPVRLNLPPMAAVAAGAWHTLALDKNGHVWAWGSDTLGQLGDGQTGKFSVSATPRKIDGLEQVAAIYSGEFHVLAARADGAVWAWGLQPGSGQVWDSPRPTKGALPVEAVAAFDFGGRVLADGQPVNDAAVSVDGGLCGKTDGHGVYHCLLPAGFSGALGARKEGFDFASAKISPLGKTLENQLIRGHAKAAKPKQNVVLKPEVRQERAMAVTAKPADASEQVREKEAIAPVVVAPQPAPHAREEAPVQKKKEAPVQQLVETHPPKVLIAGAVLLAGGQPLEGVEINAVGAQCGKTDARGEYVCSAPFGWSGRLTAGKRNYKFSPSATSFKEVREDLRSQELTAIYHPD
jgi:hypothetical protein